MKPHTPTPQKTLMLPLAAGLLILCFSAGTARAATYTWSGTTDADWNDASNWGGSGPPTTGDLLIFGAGTEATLNNDIAAGTVFQIRLDGANGYDLTGNTIDLVNTGSVVRQTTGSGTNTISLDITDTTGDTRFTTDEGTLVMAGVLTSGSNLVTSGAGTLKLTNAANDYAGTFVLGGTVAFDAGALGTGNIRLGWGSGTGTLEYIGSSAETVSNTVEIGGASTHTGGGIISNTGTGALTFDAANFNTVDSTANTRDIEFSGTGAIEVSGVIRDNDQAITLTKSGSNTLTLSGANTYTGDTTVSAGTLKVTNQSQTALGTTAGVTTVADGATLELNYVPLNNLSPIEENITLNGAGVGGTEGALKVTATGAGSEINSTITLGSDATINTAVRLDHSGTITDGANSFTLTKIGAGQHRAGFVADFAHLVIAEGEYEMSGNQALPSDTVTVNTGARLDIWRGLDLTQAGHTPTITFNDGSKFNWRGNSVNDTASIGGAMVLNGNVNFEVGGGSGKQITVESDISGTGNLDFTRLASNSGTMIFTGANSYSGNTTINSGALEIGGGGTLGSGSYAGAISFTGGATLDYNTSADQALSGDITGAGNFEQNGSGTTTLSGANTYTGSTTVSGGTLKVTTKDALGDTAGATTVADGATLELAYGAGSAGNGIAENITLNGAGVGGTEGALKITGTGKGNELNSTVTLGSNTTINTQARFDMGGTINDNGNGHTLTKTGSDYNHFMNASGVTANFTHLVIAEGDYWAGPNALPSGVGTSVTVADGAQLTTWGAQVIANSPDITFEGGSTFRTDRAGDTMSINGTMTLNGAVTFSGPQATHTANISSDIGGTGSLTKTGPNTTNFSGNNDYTGNTTISGGTLKLSAADNNIASSATIDVSAGATLDVSGITNGFALASGQTLSGAGSVAGDMTIASGAVLSPGNSPGTLVTGAQTWNDGGTYLWEINDSGGTQGADPGWDFLDITGALDLSTLTAGGFTIDIDSLTLGNLAGDANGFGTWTKGTPGDFDYEFTIATASSGINGFDAADFTLDSSGFSNAPLWDWGIVLDGNSLVLQAYAVPEPSSTALLGLGGLALMLRRKRS